MSKDQVGSLNKKFELNVSFLFINYYNQQTERVSLYDNIPFDNFQMRKILQWLDNCKDELKMSDDAFDLTLSIFIEYALLENLKNKSTQKINLILSTCLHLARKYHDNFDENSKISLKFVSKEILGNLFSEDEISKMELKILKKLGYKMTFSNFLSFSTFFFDEIKDFRNIPIEIIKNANNLLKKLFIEIYDDFINFNEFDISYLLFMLTLLICQLKKYISKDVYNELKSKLNKKFAKHIKIIFSEKYLLKLNSRLIELYYNDGN